MAKDFKYEIQEGFDFVIEETGNQSTNLRKVSWNGREYKVDLRKWYYKDGEERCSSGVTMTDVGADELTKVLCENGYGNTKEIINGIKTREDFKESMKSIFMDPESDDYDEEFEEYYDPKMLIDTETA